jgi:hypothetical protein
MSSSFACTQLRPMSLETYVLTWIISRSSELLRPSRSLTMSCQNFRSVRSLISAC